MLVSFALALLAASQSPPVLDSYDLVWRTPSGDAAGSVPMGNGELGMNAWVEPGGDLLLLLSRNDTFSEACRLLKVGRVRLSFDPPLTTAADFKQTLHLREGVLLLDYAGGHLEVFVEAERPVVRIRGTLKAPHRVRLSTEIWRTERRRLQGGELDSSWTMRGAPDAEEVWESADQLAALSEAIGWFHHNESSIVPFTFSRQGLQGQEGLAGDPLIHRTFGAVAAGAGFVVADARTLATSAPVSSFELTIAAPTPLQSSVPLAADWLHDAAALAQSGPSWSEARASTAAHWEKFWDRSWIFVSGDSPFAVPMHGFGSPRLGQDLNGHNRWEGEFAQANLNLYLLSAEEIRARARTRPEGRVKVIMSDWIVHEIPPPPPRLNTLSLEAWLRRPATGAPARIFDWITPGGSDGFLFDTHPGKDLRFIVGTRTLIAPGAWPDDGEWHHVAANYDESNGAMSIWRDGEQVAVTPATDAAPPSQVSQAYVLQRWVTACAGRGDFPIKFNGSIFTVEPAAAGQPWNPDWRRWGDCYWWQNTRLPYYPMLAAGDYDLMSGLFDFYASVVPACRARTKAYSGAQGVYFPETMTMFGTYSNGDYGWDRDGHEASEVLCPWWQWAWNQGLELLDLMLLRQAYDGNYAFARDQLLPMAREVLNYFDTRFPRDAAGILSITPTQALETHWHGVVNDMPCVAGLRSVLPRLLALPEVWTTAEDRALWQRLSAALPPLPVREAEGVRLLSPAESYDASRQNVETPELYATFPFRLAALGKSSEVLALAQEAYARRHDRQLNGWTQDGIFAARLGLIEDARANLLSRVGNSNPNYRFPVTWGPNFDWLPDQCHGSNLMLGLQEMLLQSDGDAILLFPAWPADWDVDFKLHAPRDTVIEASLQNGKLVHLVVTPESRRSDLKVMLK